MGSYSMCAVKPNIQQNVELEQGQVIQNQLTRYIRSLEANQTDLTPLEASFLNVANSSIINVMGKKQGESYQTHNSFTLTDLKIMRFLHRVAYFDVDKHSEVKHLIDPLKKAFEIGKLKEVEKTIQSMKKVRVYQGNSFTTIDYQLLDILEYIIQICCSKKHDPLTHWARIFDILFRGTNIKLSNRTSKLEGSIPTKETILFHCQSQNISFNRYHSIELSVCNMSEGSNQDNDEEEAIIQSESIISNKLILDDLIRTYDDIDTAQDFFPIGIQVVGYVGYLYSIRKYKSVFVASLVSESSIYIPRTMEELQYFLYHDHVLEILCNLKRQYVDMAKRVRQASCST